MRSGDPGGSPPRSRVRTNPGSAAPGAGVARRELTPTDEPCPGCQRQWESPRTERPHGRLLVVSSTPVIEAYGGGTETRYVCLECGHTVIHSTGRFGNGWH